MLPSVLSKITTEEFQITDWASQIAELQARIEASQSRITQLNEGNAVADELLQVAQEAKGKISDQEIITDLLVQLSRLFRGGDNPNDDNGNNPAPEPQPGDDGWAEAAVEPEQLSLDPEHSAICILHRSPAATPLTGQFCEWASPLASLLATPLCCPLEDAPQSVLQGQSVDLAQVVYSRDGFKYIDDAIAVASEVTEVSPEVAQAEQLASNFQKEVQIRGIQTICSSDGTPKFDLIWTRLSDRVATYSSPENPYNWEGGFVTYLGFSTKEIAEAWQQHLLKIGAATKCIIRKVNRLKVDTPKGVRIRWEMKCHGLSESHLQNILASDLTQPPVCNLPEPEVLAALSKFASGDRVKVVKAWANGDTRDMGRLGTVNRLVVRDGLVAVDLDDCSVQRDYTPDTIAPVTLQDLEPVVADEPAEDTVSAATDWQAEAKDLGLSLDNISPGHYLAYHKYRKLGEVIEKHDAINSYYVNREQKTMLNVGKGDGQKYSNPYECAIGLAKFLKVIVEPEVAKADLFGTWDEPTAPQQQIQVKDWVKLLATGNTYEVTQVDGDELHLLAGSERLVVHFTEVKLAMKIPATWQPF